MNVKMTPGKYLFVTGLIYFVIAMSNVFVYRFADTDYIQFAWILTLAAPFFIPFMSRWVGVKMLFRS